MTSPRMEDRIKVAAWRADQRYLTIAAGLFVILVVIAVFVSDRVIRPYGGDVLVICFLYALLRGLVRLPPTAVAAGVFAVAGAIELAQAFALVDRLDLGDLALARVVLGTRADWHDVLAYAAGAVISVWTDRQFLRRHR